MTPFEPPPAKSPTLRQGKAELSGQLGLPHVDGSGLLRAISMLENGALHDDAIVSLLKHEASVVVRQAEALHASAQQISVELRQFREKKAQSILEQADSERKTQDGNDQFVAQLIAEHETTVQSLRRERDAAIDRVRELSRGLSRIGAVSTPNLRRVSAANLTATSPTDNEATLLRARVDELLFERDRSLKLLRQLAEQRDQAESRLQVIVSTINLDGESPTPSNRPLAQRAPMNADVHLAELKDVPAVALRPPVHQTRTEPLAHTAEPALGHTFDETASGASSAVMRTSPPFSSPSTRSELDSGLDWDLTSPEKLPITLTPEAIKANAEPLHRDEDPIDVPAVSETALPLLRKKAQGEGAGSYSISASELPAEEVVVVRSRPSHPRPNR